MAKQKATSNQPETTVQPAAQTLPIALQLYTLRTLKQTPDEIFAAVAAIGYAGVELAGTYGLPAAELRARLEAHGLRVVSAHVALDMLEDDLPSVIRYQKVLGNDTLVVPWVSEALRSKSSEGWKALGRRIDTLGRRCDHAGMRLFYHNHDFEMAIVDGRPAIDWLLENAATAGVGWEMDVAWAQFGGQDVPALLARYAGRCARLHAKDLGDNAAEHGLADVGSGKLDWDAILPAAHAAGVEWYIVEHDFPTDPLASIGRSYAFLASKLPGVLG